MKRLFMFGIFSFLIFKPSISLADERNYPFRIMVAAMVTGGAGLGLTFTTLFAGSDITSETSSLKFKNTAWLNAFYAALGLDAAGVILLGTAVVFACCNIGYTPIEHADY